MKKWKAINRNSQDPLTIEGTVECVVVNENMDGKTSWVADCGSVAIDDHNSNARLIAAAPELLEALEMMVADFEGIDGLDDDIFDIARSAIAKARGEK